ncbi:hypothetical protein FE257_008283 [Aspergillus nanangensis]|uniref:Uncharacterized protein n=1 Tax=Aspergillus nanangensis TaxID=2582783 RepID=A0AAD4GUY2_ASPNN|nr:hypothetical protein FE257_008283 [Aspergillus nanangensis]
MSILHFPPSHHNWKFDLVGLLAILGESIVSEVVQPLTASRTIFLPRLLPAPHALIRPSRRTALPSTPITGVATPSGHLITSLPYFADMIHQIDRLEPCQVSEYRIRVRSGDENKAYHRPPKLAKVKPLAPLRVLTIASFLWTVGILVWAVLLGDGPAVVAIVLVGTAGSMHSAASFWQSTTRNYGYSTSGAGDGREGVVLRTREGAFIVVHCNAIVARLLYMGDARCDYVAGGMQY